MEGHQTKPSREEHGLACDAVSHRYGERRVLTDVSLRINPGEVLAIIGPSGAGKTTLFRLLAMFSPPAGGTVRLDDTDVWSLTDQDRLDRRRRVSMVFQQPNLFDASVERNVKYGDTVRSSWHARVRSLLRDTLRTNGSGKLTESLSLVGMGDQKTRGAKSLSGGEAQRVAFARALAWEPAYLLLDEPTSDLDPQNTAVIESAIDAARRDGLGIGVATHDMHQAERIADRVAVLLDGRIVEIGAADRVFSNPRDERSRKFVNGELVA